MTGAGAPDLTVRCKAVQMLHDLTLLHQFSGGNVFSNDFVAAQEPQVWEDREGIHGQKNMATACLVIF